MPVSTQFLRQTPYFADLSPADLERVKERVLEKSFERGDIIFLEGEPCRGLYFVASGKVKILKTSPEGREQVLRIMEPGDSFNEVPIFDGGPNPATAQAMDRVSLYFLPKEGMLEMVLRYPSLATAVLRVFADRLRHLTFLVADLSFRHVTGRLAKVLLQYADDLAAEGSHASQPKYRITQQELAALVGTAREMIGRSLRSLEDKGAIRMQGHRILIVDRKALRDLI